ncbi:histidine kinase [Nocardioides sp. Soil805]|uniref:histidine kinase n=1 Tax=Nocardioides sp. Soil805 TaxID=1736416 RepID=UPI0007028982|nr:histidine kinase [Nocardioides sp. Soil805]KRF37443.1 hypothetical protein ASG94_08980 [Nocardioides sp. Soil805]
MVFSGSAVRQRSDLLEIVSVLDLDAVLERAATIGAHRTGARRVVLAVLDDVEDSCHGEQPRLLVHGIDPEAAAVLRERLGDAGLPLADERAGGREPDVLRTLDPESGDEVLRVPVLVHGRLFADLLLADPAGDGFADAAVESIAELGRVTGVAVRNALSYALSERRREAVELAAAVDQSLRPPFLLAEPMARIAEGARRIAGARTAAVVAAGEHGVDVTAVAGERSDALPRLLDRVAEQARTAQGDGADFTARVDGETVWGVPLSPDHAYVGVVVLVLDPARTGRFPEDRSLLTSFVRHGSLVLDHGVLQQERQHAVLEADRDRIARDLHDVVIQRLYATGLTLRARTAHNGTGTTGTGVASADHVAEAIREINDSIRDIRSTIFALERGSSGSLRRDVLALAQEYESALGFLPVVRTWGPVDSLVEQDLAEQATVVLREALSNCARHAHASRCEVDVSAEHGLLTLTVTDDGRGAGTDDGPRSGLRNLAARARELGGGLDVGPADGRGTRLRWQVRLDRQAGPEPTSGAEPSAPGAVVDPVGEPDPGADPVAGSDAGAVETEG